MTAARRTLHLVRPGSSAPDEAAPADTVHPLPAPLARPEEWNRVLTQIFDHDVAVIW